MTVLTRPSAAAVTHRRVLRMALPIVAANATVPLLGAVDTAVVGRLGEAAPIGAVGLGAVVIGALYWVWGFLRMGTTGLTAQARGAGDRAEVAANLSRALLVGLGGGILLILLQSLLVAGALALAPASEAVEMLARDYLAIRIWSAPAAVALFGINGWLIGQERSGAVFVLQAAQMGLNATLDIWFVLGLGWGVAGVAGATALAEWTGLLLGLWMCRAVLRGRDWRDRARVLDSARLRRMARVNADILVRTLLLEAVLVSFLFWGAGLGDVALAANQVLLQFLTITAFALDGFAFAAEAVVGTAFGARSPAGVRAGLQVASLWAAATGLALGAGFALLGGPAIDLMTTAPDVREAARMFLPWMALAPVTGVAAWMLDGVFLGATRTRDLRNAMAGAVAIYFGALLILAPLWGNHGLWAALHVSFLARTALLARRYPALERAAGAAP